MRNYWRKLGAVLLTHLNAVAFFSGFALAGYGIARWSLSAALVSCGVCLMVIAARPYLQRPRGKSS